MTQSVAGLTQSVAGVTHSRFPWLGQEKRGVGVGGEKYSLCWHPSGVLLCVKRALCSQQHFSQEQTTINFGEMINLV